MCPTRVVRRRRPERPIADQPRDRPSTASTSFVLDGGGDLDGEPSSGRILIVTVTGTVDSVDSEVVRRVLAQPLDGERRGRGARDSAGLLPLVGHVTRDDVTDADESVRGEYDEPTATNDDDVDFGIGDYDLLSPYQRPASDVDGSISSNRSSFTSAGSPSSGCASVRSVHSPSVSARRSTTAAGALRMNGLGPQLSDQSAARRCVSEATSDGSADSASR